MQPGHHGADAESAQTGSAVHQGQTTGFLHRLGYAAAGVSSQSRSGHPQFNFSEVGGTLIVANVGNLAPGGRAQRDQHAGTLGHTGDVGYGRQRAQEFWPDMRRIMRPLTGLPADSVAAPASSGISRRAYLLLTFR